MQPKLLADEMLAKLVRILRVMGIPVDYVKRLDDDEILKIAKAGKYSLLTCDEELANRCRKGKIGALYLPQAPAERQAAAAISHFGLRLAPFQSATLCPKCGGRLLQAKKSSLTGVVYPAVLKRRHLFWRCCACGHVYWSGTHYARLRKAYCRIKALVSTVRGT